MYFNSRDRPARAGVRPDHIPKNAHTINPDSMHTEPSHEQVIRCQNESVKKDKRPSKSPCILEKSLDDVMLEVVRCGSNGRQMIVILLSDGRQINVKWESNAIYAFFMPISTQHDSIVSCFLTELTGWCS